MKRALSLLLVVGLLMTVSGCSASAKKDFLPSGELDSFAVASPVLTEPIAVSDTELCDRLRTVIDGAQGAKKLPPGAESVAVITLYHSGGDPLTIDFVTTSGQYYVVKEGRGRLLSVDGAESLVQMLDQLSEKVLPFAWPPLASIIVDGEKHETAMVSANYSYLSISGRRLEPPLFLEEPPEPIPVTADSSIGFSVDLPADRLTATVFRGDEVMWEGDAAQIGDFDPVRSGEYTVTLRADYDDGYDPDYYHGEVVWEAVLNYLLPISFAVQGSDTVPGELVVLRAYNVPEGESVSLETRLPSAVRFFPDGEGGMIGLLPLATIAITGEYPMTLRCGGLTETYALTVREKEFEIQHMKISETTAAETILSRQANEEFARIIYPLREVGDSARHWEGDFIWPVSGGISTSFGVIRYVNDSTSSSRHNAIDLDVPAGTPVAATNSGTVLYAGFLQLTGNTVLIEHGYGLKSWYYHMQSLNCETGQTVKKGELIGEVGSTGFSTGPHLHFGISVFSVFVNPHSIIDTDILTADFSTP